MWGTSREQWWPWLHCGTLTVDWVVYVWGRMVTAQRPYVQSLTTFPLHRHEIRQSEAVDISSGRWVPYGNSRHVDTCHITVGPADTVQHHMMMSTMQFVRRYITNHLSNTSTQHVYYSHARPNWKFIFTVFRNEGILMYHWHIKLIFFMHAELH